MTTRRLLLVTGVSVAVIVVGLVCIPLLFARKVERLELRHRLALGQRAMTWEVEAAKRQVAARQDDQIRLQRQHKERLAAFGGPVPAAAKNPHLTIAGMIQSVAELCAGERRGVVVTVDRFTEFSLIIQLDTPGMVKSPAEIAPCVLGQVGPYLHRLQFIRRGIVLAELDRQALESVPDWTNVSPEAVRALLAPSMEATANLADAVTANDTSSQAPDEERNLTRREQLQNEAMRGFRSAMTNSLEKMLLAIRQQNSSTVLADVRGLADMNAKQDLLLASDRNLAEAQAFFGNMAEQYRRALVATGLDALFIETVLRAPASAEAVRPSPTLAVIERAQYRGRSASRVLEIMTKSFGTWSYDPATRQIEFGSSLVASSYQEASGQLQRDTSELEAALSRWSSAVKR